MTPKEIILSQLDGTWFLYDTFVKDFSDSDAQYQPCDGGIHLNWILTHVAVTADQLMCALNGEKPKLSSSVHETYTGGVLCKKDDGMTRAEAWKMFSDMHNHTVEFVKNFPESRYDEKAPEGMPPMFTTVGAIVGLLGTHPYWHFGQLSVNRRMLNKPMLLGAPGN